MKLKQKSLIINVFAKAAFAALLLSGLQPVLVYANQVNTVAETQTVEMQTPDLSAPVHLVGNNILPDLQKSFSETKENNFGCGFKR